MVSQYNDEDDHPSSYYHKTRKPSAQHQDSYGSSKANGGSSRPALATLRLSGGLLFLLLCAGRQLWTTTNSSGTTASLTFSGGLMREPEGERIAKAKPTKTTSSTNATTTQRAARAKAGRRRTTEAGIDLTDPGLYESVALASTAANPAAVVGMAVGQSLVVLQRFVGSLRRSGFAGRVLLLVEPDPPADVKRYLEYRSVAYRAVQQPVECTGGSGGGSKGGDADAECGREHPTAHPAALQLLRDLLTECAECTGPVLSIGDVAATVFQRPPFDDGDDGASQSPSISGLQVYDEGQDHRTTLPWTADPIRACTIDTAAGGGGGGGASYDEPNLWAGATVGTRAATLKHWEVVFAEQQAWAGRRADGSASPPCEFDSDEPILNHLYYSDQLPFATAVRLEEGGGVVNNLALVGRRVVREHVASYAERKGLRKNQQKQARQRAMKVPFDGTVEGTGRWIGGDRYGSLIDDEGFFLDRDGSRSRVVRKYDAFLGETNDPADSHFYRNWLGKQSWLQDNVPDSFVSSPPSSTTTGQGEGRGRGENPHREQQQYERTSSDDTTGRRRTNEALKLLLVSALVTLVYEFLLGHILEHLKIVMQTSPPGMTYARVIKKITAEKGAAGLWDGFVPWGVVQALCKGAVFGLANSFATSLLVPFADRGIIPYHLAYTLAGGIGGGFQGLVLSPTLLLKTRVMTNEVFREKMSMLRSSWLSFRIGFDLVATEGVTTLMKGSQLFATKRVCDWASRYFFSDFFEASLLAFKGDGEPLTLAEKSLASLLGGIASTCATLPLDVLVAKMQQSKMAGINVSPLQLFRDELKERGWAGQRRAYMQGFEARLLHVSLTTVVTKTGVPIVDNLLFPQR